MKEVRMLFSLILRVLIFVIGFGAWMYLVYGLASGTIPLWDRGLAVDSKGNVYVGSKMYIQVYSASGEQRNKFYAQTETGYRFTIRSDELYVNQGEYVVVLDLNGNKLRTEDIDSVLWNQLSLNTCIAENGVRYKISMHDARKSIMRETDEGWVTIVQMPIEVCYTLLLCFVCIGIAAISALSIIYQFKRDLF